MSEALRSESGDFSPRPIENNFERGEEVKKVLFGKEEIECKITKFNEKFPAQFFEDADSFRKIGLVKARQATEREVITTSQDGNREEIAEAGDWIIQNPGDESPYVFGDKRKKITNENGEEVEVNVSVEERQAAFAKKYEPKPGEEGIFIPKGIIKAKQVNENLTWETDWGSRDAVKAGGWVSSGGYGIAEESFFNTYEKIEKNN